MEKPNLKYIEEIAAGDASIKKTLIDIVKQEFPEEAEEYYKSLELKDFEELASNVHRLKHKISILGLVNNYEVANKFEHNLKEKSLDGVEDFEKILKLIFNYLKTI